jgi:hypothetical protein
MALNSANGSILNGGDKSSEQYSTAKFEVVEGVEPMFSLPWSSGAEVVLGADVKASLLDLAAVEAAGMAGIMMAVGL